MQIQSKLIVALFFLGVLLCTALYFLMQWSFDRGMIHYVNQVEAKNSVELIEALQNYYREHRSWGGLVGNKYSYGDLVYSSSNDRDGDPESSRDFQTRPESKPRPGGPGRGPGPGSGSGFRSGPGPGGPGPGPEPKHRKGKPPLPALLDKNKKVLIGRYDSGDLFFPLKVDNILVGWIVKKAPLYSTDEATLSIKNNLGLVFYLVILALVFCVLFIGLPLSRHIVRPLGSLADAANMLTQGDYAIQLGFKRSDEIGKLARDFETLATTLQSNEVSRSRWVAGISHELRTPLAIITGEIDAMLERIRPLNNENLGSLKQEIEQLTHLVNDLYELSNAEIGALRYTKSKVNMCDVVYNASQRFEDLLNAKQLKINLDLPDGKYWVSADVQRLNQLLNNLLVNEVKYAKEGALVLLSLRQVNNTLLFSVEDSGPGVPTEHLGRLFDYIYRVDYSRNRKTGGSGLGLAICRKIVEAHDGLISASHSHLGGLKISVELPITT